MASGSIPPETNNDLQATMIRFMAQMNEQMQNINLKFQDMDTKMQLLSNHQKSTATKDEHEQTSSNSSSSKNDDLNAIKLKIPPFHGRNDPEEFLDWIEEIDAKFRI